MKKKSVRFGVYCVPPIWRGPPGDVPEKIRREGIDAKRIHVDPSKLMRFRKFTNQIG